MADVFLKLAPIFFYFLVGVALRRFGLADRSHGDFVLRLAFFVTLPLLILLTLPQATLTAEKAGALARYLSPERAAFAPEYLDPEGYWTVFRQEPKVFGYNTGLIKKEAVPTTFDGLADPSLKGKLARPGVGAVPFVLGIYEVMGTEKGTEYLTKLAANEPRLYPSNTALGNALASGEVPIVFEQRTRGVSKIDSREIYRAAWHVLATGLRRAPAPGEPKP